MLKKTHIAVGAASGILTGIAAGTIAVSAHPVLSLIASVAIGAFAAVLPDVDAVNSKTHKTANRLSGIVLFAILTIMLVKYYCANTVIERLFSTAESFRLPEQFFNGIIGLSGIAILCIIGKDTPHRSFTHSILALVIVAACAAMVSKPFMLYMAAGYLSHLAIDVINKKGEELLFPIPVKFCFYLCRSDGLCNTILMWVGIALTILMAAFECTVIFAI